HASFKVMGTLSDRMAGADKLNPQGFERGGEVREIFTLADEDYRLEGGDFDAFEPAIGDAVYDDEGFRQALLTERPCECLKKFNGSPKPECDDCHGTGSARQKVHAIYGMELSGLSYEQVVATKG